MNDETGSGELITHHSSFITSRYPVRPMGKLRRIAILTGGGDCPGLNAVIRAVVRTAMRDHNLEVLGVQLGFEGLINRSVVSMTGDLIRGILPKGGTLLRTTNRGNP